MLIIVFDDCDDHKFKSFVGIADMQFCRLEKLCPPDGSKVRGGVKVKTRKIKCQLRDISTTRLLNVWNKAIKRCDWSWPTRWLRSTSTPVSSPGPTSLATSSSYLTPQNLVSTADDFFPLSHLHGLRFFCVLWLHEDLPSTRWYINHVTLNYFFLLCQQKYVNVGQLFHFEFMISRLTKSFDIFITASWWVLHSGECEMDYVQFGRDILFITSHRSNK